MFAGGCQRWEQNLWTSRSFPTDCPVASVRGGLRHWLCLWALACQSLVCVCPLPIITALIPVSQEVFQLHSLSKLFW